MSNPIRLLASEYDTPVETRSPPQNYLLICTTPRTGGHALNAALRAQGWGVPMEYFNPDFMIPLQQRWIDKDVKNFAEAKGNLEIYGQHLAEKRATGQLLSVKLLSDHLASFEQAFANSKITALYIYLTRRDKIAQTISLAATLLTGRAFNGDFKLKYIHRINSLDDQKMMNIYDWLASSEAFWMRHVSKLPATNVVKLDWEEFQANPKQCLGAIAKKFSLPYSEEKTEHFDEPYRTDIELKMELKGRFGNLLEDHALAASKNAL